MLVVMSVRFPWFVVVVPRLNPRCGSPVLVGSCRSPPRWSSMLVWVSRSWMFDSRLVIHVGLGSPTLDLRFPPGRPCWSRFLVLDLRFVPLGPPLLVPLPRPDPPMSSRLIVWVLWILSFGPDPSRRRDSDWSCIRVGSGPRVGRDDPTSAPHDVPALTPADVPSSSGESDEGEPVHGIPPAPLDTSNQGFARRGSVWWVRRDSR